MARERAKWFSSDGIIAELGIVKQQITNINSETVGTPLKPKPGSVQYGILHFRVMEIQPRHGW